MIEAASCGPAFKGRISGGTGRFVVYDGTLYRNKPDLSALGIERVSIIDRGIWPPADPSMTPDPERVAKVTATFPDNDTPVVLDFERFPLVGSEATVADSVRRLRGILAAFRKQQPGRHYGIYAALPISDYWRAVNLDTANAKFRSWQADNDRLKSLEADVDVLFPSLYTFYDDPERLAKLRHCTDLRGAPHLEAAGDRLSLARVPRLQPSRAQSLPRAGLLADGTGHCTSIRRRHRAVGRL